MGSEMCIRDSEEGREQQAKDTAIRMSKRGRSIEEIADCVDFDLETVRKWLITSEVE